MQDKTLTCSIVKFERFHESIQRMNMKIGSSGLQAHCIVNVEVQFRGLYVTRLIVMTVECGQWPPINTSSQDSDMD